MPSTPEDSNIGSWNTARVTTMQCMFEKATAFNQNIGDWNVASVTTFNAAFANPSFNRDISKWNVAAVTDLRYFLSTNGVFNQNIASWSVALVTTMTSAFNSASALSSCNQGAIYRLWGATLRAVYPTWSSESSACLIDTNIGTAVTAWVTSPTTAAATYGNIGDWNTAAVSSMYNMFQSATPFNQNIASWNTASVSNMASVRPLLKPPSPAAMCGVWAVL